MSTYTLSIIVDGIDNASAPLEKINNSMAALGKGVVAGFAAAGAAALTLGGTAFAAGNQIDSAFDNIVIGTGAAGDALAGLQEDFRIVFTSIPTNAEPASKVLAELNTRLGLTGGELRGMSIPLLEMTRMLGGDAVRNSQLFARVVGDWGIPLPEGTNLLDRLFVAGQTTGIGLESLMLKVVQFGSPMRLMGFTLNEAISLFGKWEKEGVNAELVMGSLRIAAGKFAREGIGLKEGLWQTIGAIKSASSESEGLALAMEIFGARAGPDMAAAIREGRFEIEDLVTALENADGAILNTSERTSDWGEMLQILKNKSTIALEPIGMFLLDIANSLMDKALPAFDKLTERSEELGASIQEKIGYIDSLRKRIEVFGLQKALTPNVWQNLLGLDTRTFDYLSNILRIGIGTMFAGLGAAFTGSFLAMVGPTLVGPLAGFFMVFLGLAASLKTVLLAVGGKIASGLFTGLLLGLSNLSPVLGGAFFRFFMVGGVLEAGLAAIAAKFSGMTGAVAGLFQPLLPFAPLMGSLLGFFAVATVALAGFGIAIKIAKGDTEFFANILGKLQNGLGLIGQFWQEQGPAIAEIGMQVWAALSEAAEKLADKIMPWLAEKFEQFGQWFVDNGPLITAFVATLADFFTNKLLPAIVGFWDVIEPLLDAFLEAFGGIVTAVMQAATGDWAGAWETIKGVVNTAWAGIQEAWKNFTNWVTGWFGSDWASVVATWETNWELFKSITSRAWGIIVAWTDEKTQALADGLATWWSNLKSDWETNWTLLGEIVRNAWQRIVDMVTDKIAEIASAVRNGASALRSAGIDLLQGLLDGMESMARDILDFVLGLAADIAEAFAGILNIQSPSRVFIAFGKNIGQGLINGMQAMTPGVDRASSDVAQATMSPFTAMRGGPQTTQQHSFGGTINLYVSGSGDPDKVADAIFKKLRQQGVAI